MASEPKVGWAKWVKGWLSGGPHFIVGTKANPYLHRWYILPRNPWLNLYLHKFLRDDEDRALHDHPWWFVSLMLKGGYDEVTPKGTVTSYRTVSGVASSALATPSSPQPALWKHSCHRHCGSLVDGSSDGPQDSGMGILV